MRKEDENRKELYETLFAQCSKVMNKIRSLRQPVIAQVRYFRIFSDISRNFVDFQVNGLATAAGFQLVRRFQVENSGFNLRSRFGNRIIQISDTRCQSGSLLHHSRSCCGNFNLKIFFKLKILQVEKAGEEHESSQEDDGDVVDRRTHHCARGFPFRSRQQVIQLEIFNLNLQLEIQVEGSFRTWLLSKRKPLRWLIRSLPFRDRLPV